MAKRSRSEKAPKKPLASILATVLDVPQKVVSKAPNIELSGNNEVMVGSLQDILEYSENRIKISSGSMIIVLYGTNFEIKEFSKNGIIISGFVKTMEFVD